VNCRVLSFNEHCQTQGSIGMRGESSVIKVGAKYELCSFY